MDEEQYISDEYDDDEEVDEEELDYEELPQSDSDSESDSDYSIDENELSDIETNLLDNLSEQEQLRRDFVKKSKRFKTPNYLTKYEIARLVGARAVQIAHNSPVMIDIEELKKELNVEYVSPIQIAQKELILKKLPLAINRPLVSKAIDKPYYETRYMQDLILL